LAALYGKQAIFLGNGSYNRGKRKEPREKEREKGHSEKPDNGIMKIRKKRKKVRTPEKKKLR